MLGAIGYISESTSLLKKGEIEKIVATALSYNKSHNITGILYFCNGRFLQFIEGEREEVEALYKRIEIDLRHHYLVRVYDKAIQERSFGDWEMAVRYEEDFEAGDIKIIDDMICLYTDKVNKLPDLNHISIKAVLDVFSRQAVKR